MSESLPPEKNARDRAFGIACWTLGALAFVLLLMVGVSFSLTARTVVVEKVVETPVPVPVQQNPEGPAAVEEVIKKGAFDLVFERGAVIDVKPQYDITRQVIERMNQLK